MIVHRVAPYKERKRSEENSSHGKSTPSGKNSVIKVDGERGDFRGDEEATNSDCES